MRHTRLAGWCAAACVTVAVAACGGKKTVAAIDPVADVSGRWHLNDEQSDDAAAKIAAARTHSRPDDAQGGGGERGGYSGGSGGGYGGGRGGHGRMGGGGGGRQMDPQEMERRRERAELLVNLAEDASPDLDVRLTAAGVRLISHETVDTLDLKLDGSALKTKLPGQGDDQVQITTKASWSDGWLVISREVDGGGKITETLLRSADHQHLYEVIHVELPRFRSGQEIEFRRVYDPVTGG